MHRNASPHSHPSSGVPWEGLPWSHMGVNTLAVHSEQAVCNEHTKQRCASGILCIAACAVLSCSSSTGDLLSPWPWVIWRIGIFQLHCRLMGSLSYVIYLTETSIMWHTTWQKATVIRAEKQSAGSVVLVGQEAQQRQKDPPGFFQPSLVKVLLWQTMHRWG